MARAKQLTISHENRPGMVAKIAKVLGDAKVNILNCLTTTSGTDVELPNTPGALAKFTGKLAEKNINITMGYATGGEGSRKTTVVLAVSDVDKAAGIR